MKTVADTSDEDWDSLMGVNARGVFMMCREIIKLMETQGGGSIINISSISAHHADTSMALYNASKAFVNGLTRSIAVDHGHKGIRCNAICPGWIMTEMADESFAMAKNPEAAKADALLRHPSGRFGQPTDIARAIHMYCDRVGFLVKGSQTKSFLRMGSRRTRLPVAAKTALATTGPINGVPISPIPAGNSWLSMKCILMLGVSLSLIIG